MHTATFTVDGAIGGGRVLAAKTFPGIARFTWDIEKQLLEIVDEDGVSTFIDVATMASVTVTDAGGYITGVTVAD